MVPQDRRTPAMALHRGLVVMVVVRFQHMVPQDRRTPTMALHQSLVVMAVVHFQRMAPQDRCTREVMVRAKVILPLKRLANTRAVTRTHQIPSMMGRSFEEVDDCW